MTTKEVAQICGVTDECIRQNAKVIGVELGDRWHPHEWTDDEVKKVQLALMKNQTTRGNMTTETVSKVTQVNLGEGLAINVLSNSGDVEAMKEYCEMLIQKTQAQHDLLLEQQKNQLLLEENSQIKKDTLVIAGWAEQRSVLAYSIAHHLNWNLNKRKEVGKQLSVIARQFNHNVGKVTDRDFGEVNAYGADTWALWESRFKK